MDIAGVSPLGGYGAIRPTQSVSQPKPVEDTPAVGSTNSGGSANSGAANDKPLSGFGSRLGGGAQGVLLAAQEGAQAAQIPSPAGSATKAAPSSLNIAI